jgi:hypothetical protein
VTVVTGTDRVGGLASGCVAVSDLITAITKTETRGKCWSLLRVAVDLERHAPHEHQARVLSTKI